MSKRILFITTHNLATNPRLVKEIDLAISHGFVVEVICFVFPIHHWSTENDKAIKESYGNVKFIPIDAGRKHTYKWFISVLLERLFTLFAILFPLSDKFLSYAVSRRSYLILSRMREASTADLVVGHNPGSMYPAWLIAKKMNAMCGFDIEDYHPGEGRSKHRQRITLRYLSQLLPTFDYRSFSSVSIMNQCLQKIKPLQFIQNMVIQNTFPKDEFVYTNSSSSQKLQLVWFSQNIDKGRGLEKLLPIVAANSNKVELTLFGHAQPDFKRIYQDLNGIHWAGTLTQKDLHQQLSRFDVGLAIEPGKDLNNQLALSNKIMAYAQSGLFIAATDTIEQKRFLRLHQSLGLLIKSDFSDLEKTLLELSVSIDSIRTNRINRFDLSKELAWENTTAGLLEIWNR